MVGGDPIIKEPFREMIPWRMALIPFGTAASTFLAACSNQYHLRTVEREFPLTAKLMKGSIYVHDVMVGGQSIEEPTKMCHKAK